MLDKLITLEGCGYSTLQGQAGLLDSAVKNNLSTKNTFIK
jgi:hypothetical protein